MGQINILTGLRALYVALVHYSNYDLSIKLMTSQALQDFVCSGALLGGKTVNGLRDFKFR